MQNFRNYTPEALAGEPSFIRWKLFNVADDAAFWEVWLLQHPDKQEVVDQADQLLTMLHKVYDNRQPDNSLVEAGIQRLIGYLETHTEIHTRPLWPKVTLLRIAAGLLLVAGSWLGYQRLADQAVSYQVLVNATPRTLTEVVNHRPHPVTITLPDRSTVLLQPKSRLSFPRSFSDSTREVFLSGQGFFSVTHNATQPFVVKTHRLTTRVLGTSFLVQAIEGMPQARVIVRTGKVRVSATGRRQQTQSATLDLTPNQQATITDTRQTLVRSLVDQPLLLQPVSMQFKASSITTVFQQLETAYGIPIRFNEGLMQDCYLTATFTNEPLFDKLTLICHTIDARYTVSDGQIFITSKGCIN